MPPPFPWSGPAVRVHLSVKAVEERCFTSACGGASSLGMVLNANGFSRPSSGMLLPAHVGRWLWFFVGFLRVSQRCRAAWVWDLCTGKPVGHLGTCCT